MTRCEGTIQHIQDQKLAAMDKEVKAGADQPFAKSEVEYAQKAMTKAEDTLRTAQERVDAATAAQKEAQTKSKAEKAGCTAANGVVSKAKRTRDVSAEDRAKYEENAAKECQEAKEAEGDLQRAKVETTTANSELNDAKKDARDKQRALENANKKLGQLQKAEADARKRFEQLIGEYAKAVKAWSDAREAYDRCMNPKKPTEIRFK
jgi:chromosome segregation ATPase